MGLYIHLCALCATFSGFMYGYDVGSVSGVKDMLGYRKTLNLSYNYSGTLISNQSCNFQDDVETNSILGLIVTLYFVGGLIGALSGGALSDYIGRKPVLMLGGCLVGIGGLIHTAAVHIGMVFVGRFLAGSGTGAVYQVTPIFVAEIVPEHLRGRYLSCFNFIAVMGLTLGLVINFFVQDLIYGWRISLSIQFLGGIILVLAMTITPRSPRWLVLHGRETHAREVLRRIYMDDNKVEHHLMEIKRRSYRTKSVSSTLKFIFQWNVFQRVLVGFLIILLGRLAGGSFVTYFSVTIFCEIGLPGFSVSISIGITAVLSMMVSVIIIDKFGRKSLFLTGLGIMVIGLIIAATLIATFHLDDITDESNSRNTVAVYFTLILVCMYMAGFNLACSNVPWIILGELFPLTAKGFMTSICSSAYWIGLIISNQLGPILISSPLRVYGTLILFLADIIVLFFIVLFTLPETKGILLEDIEKLYSVPWKDRINVLYYLKCCCFVEPCRTKVTTAVYSDTAEIGLVNNIEEDNDDVSSINLNTEL